MYAYRVASGRRIAPFGDLARELYIATETLASWQEAACRACGLEVRDVEDPAAATERPALLFSDDVFFTEMALRQFVAAVMGGREDAQLFVPESAALRAVRVLDDEPELVDGAAPFDVFWLATPGIVEELSAARRRARPVKLEALERTTRLTLPALQGTREAPVTARVVGRVRHWLHLLRLSQLAIGVRIAAELRRRPGMLLGYVLLRRKDPWALSRRIRVIHPTARVHPTADVECSVIGPGVVVHAHAHVHRSILGAGVEIGDHAVVMGSTLAERVHVLRASYFALCAAMPGGTLASYKAQLSLFGRDVFLTSSAWLIDAKLAGGKVRVEHEGRLVTLETSFLGSCLGHRATLGAQVTIQAGRAVPNGVTVVAPPGTFASALPAYPEGSLLTIREGRLEPVELARRDG